MVPIEKLPDLNEAVPGYVPGLVAERTADIRSLPAPAMGLLGKCRGVVIDVGPGEGISSMALAGIVPAAEILGIEMDSKHLAAAWPLCKNYRNLHLWWGALPPNPSNARVDSGVTAPGAPVDDDQFRCNVLFSWIGMSRRDIFEGGDAWSGVVQEACVLIVPCFWRQGVGVLGDGARSELEGFVDRLRLPRKEWDAALGLKGFSRTETFPVGKAQKAHGWVLWLSGLFDASNLTLWDILRDKWRKPAGVYQLPSVELEMEVVIGYK